MIKKIENCIYCGEKMEDVKSAKRKFCNDKCRIYYGRELSRGTLVVPVKVNDPVIPVAPPSEKKTVPVQAPSEAVNTPKIEPRVPFEKEKWFFAEKYTLHPATSKPLIPALVPKWKLDKSRSDAAIKKAWEKFREEG
jgi:hypothetical protein